MVDRRVLSMVGYQPGKMKWFSGAALVAAGTKAPHNWQPDSSVCTDRELVTGASPKACNTFGMAMVAKLLEFHKKDCESN